MEHRDCAICAEHGPMVERQLLSEERQENAFGMIKEMHAVLLGNLATGQAGVMERLRTLENAKDKVERVGAALGWRVFDIITRALPWIVIVVGGAYIKEKGL